MPATTFIACQITVPANAGAFASIRSLLPGFATTALGGSRIERIDVVPVGVAVDVRTDPAQAGYTLAADVEKVFPAYGAADAILLRSSSAATVPMRLLITVA